MKEDTFDIELRKVPETAGVTAHRGVEKAVRPAVVTVAAPAPSIEIGRA